ncbi:MAG TPA: prepilin peptidase, partial [Rhodopila sp.]|nr:prepilin peptidase [Rhodopila sp.]
MSVDPRWVWPAWVLPLLAAPFVGSFLGVLITRLPHGQPIALDRSRCPHCRTALGVPDLVPVLSYAALRGRCRHCGRGIGVFHPAVELAALALAVVAASVLVDLPSSTTQATDTADQTAIMKQINTAIEGCSFATSETFT